MMKCSIVIFVACVFALGEAGPCIKATLQEEIDYTRIEGLWHQYRYTSGTQYEEMKCFNLKIYNVNKATTTFHMESKFKPQSLKKGLSHSAFAALDSTTNWGVREEGSPFIGDHLATDYENYMLLYQCDKATGEAIIDLELKAGVPNLSAAKVEEVSSLLDKIGVKYNDLKPVDQSVCDYPK